MTWRATTVAGSRGGIDWTYRSRPHRGNRGYLPGVRAAARILLTWRLGVPLDSGRYGHVGPGMVQCQHVHVIGRLGDAVGPVASLRDRDEPSGKTVEGLVQFVLEGRSEERR